MGTAESVEALYLARASRSTGSLVFQTGMRQAKVLWRDGDVVGLELEFGFQSQIQCLLASGRLSLDQMDGLWARGEADEADDELLQALSMSKQDVRRLQILSTVTKLVQDAEQVTFQPASLEEAQTREERPAALEGSALVRSVYRPMTPLDASVRVRVRDRKGCEAWCLTDEDRTLIELMSEFQGVASLSPAQQGLIALLIRAGKMEVESARAEVELPAAESTPLELSDANSVPPISEALSGVVAQTNELGVDTGEVRTSTAASFGTETRSEAEGTAVGQMPEAAPGESPDSMSASSETRSEAEGTAVGQMPEAAPGEPADSMSASPETSSDAWSAAVGEMPEAAPGEPADSMSVSPAMSREEWNPAVAVTLETVSTGESSNMAPIVAAAIDEGSSQVTVATLNETVPDEESWGSAAAGGRDWTSAAGELPQTEAAGLTENLRPSETGEVVGDWGAAVSAMPETSEPESPTWSPASNSTASFQETPHPPVPSPFGGEPSRDAEWLYAESSNASHEEPASMAADGSAEMPLIDVSAVEMADESGVAEESSQTPVLDSGSGESTQTPPSWTSMDAATSAALPPVPSSAFDDPASAAEAQALADAERLVAEAQARVESSTALSPPSLWENSAGFEPWSPSLEESVQSAAIAESSAWEDVPSPQPQSLVELSLSESEASPVFPGPEPEASSSLPSAAPPPTPILHAGAEDISRPASPSDFDNAIHAMSWADAIPDAIAPHPAEVAASPALSAQPAAGWSSSNAKGEEGDLWSLVNLNPQAHSGQAETLEQALQSEAVLDELMSFQLPPTPTSAPPVPDLFEATIEESEASASPEPSLSPPPPGKDETMEAASWDEDDLAGDPSDPIEAARLRRQRLLRRAIQNLGAFPQRPAPPATEGAVSIDASEMPAGAPTPTSPASTPPAAAAPPEGADDQAMRGQIEKRFEMIQSKPDHFTMLGLERTASRDQVKSAFLSLAKVFHPDRLPPALKDLSPKMTQIFEAIRDAYDKLYDDAKRDSYLTELKIKDQRASRHVTPAEEAMEAFRAGEALLKKRDYPAAEAEFLRASGLDNKAVFMAARAWILYADPARKDAAKAKQLMSDALKLDPKCDRAHYQLGLLARIEGATDKAEKHFREATRINPKHVEANQELRLIEMRKKKGK